MLTEAVRLRMLRADVPVGSYLSGGLDSSLVAALGYQAKGSSFHTFSVRFDDAEYDETHYQRRMARSIGSQHHEISVSAADIADAFPAVVFHAERPLLRTAAAPMYLLSELVARHGIKVVLTGEGADELFAGYDLFREAQVRRFWGRQPDSRSRPRLLERLYPYLARSPVGERTMAQEYFGRGRERWREPGFGHDTRWRSTAALQRLFSSDLRHSLADLDVASRLLGRLPSEFATWPFLAQDQHLEVTTLLSSYLLSAQGDRMLMAHSIEGRFPFLDPALVDLANSLPPTFKLRGLDEKHLLKRVALGLVPNEIIKRPKQPYRAPDARAFAGPKVPDWVAELISPSVVAEAGIFEPAAVDRLWRKCREGAASHQPSNADNMALCGVLSIALLHDRFIRQRPEAQPISDFGTLVERTSERPTSMAPGATYKETQRR